MTRGSATAKRTDSTTESGSVGPPLLLLGGGFASVLVALVLVPAGNVTSHLIGYFLGAIVPVFLIGLVRRVDLERRRNPRYVARTLLGRGLFVLALAAIAVAVLHVWPIATELAS